MKLKFTLTSCILNYRNKQQILGQEENYHNFKDDSDNIRVVS